MKAVVVRQFGDPSVLRYEEIEAPLPAPGEVLIRVHAAGTNPVDAGNRADGSWAEVALPWVPGYELAGVIQAVGPGAGPAGTSLVPGQRVLAMTGFRRQGGGYAEFAVVAASQVVVLADSVSFIDAAATPLAGGTAWQVLTRLSLQPGDRLLVLGASGGVGSFLLQLAAQRGIEITAVGRREHHRRMLRLGASRCIDYTEGGAPASVAEGSVDAIADLAGGPGIRSWLAAVRSFGQLASIAEPDLDLGQLVDENLTFHGVLWAPSGQTARALAGMLADDRLTASISCVLPLAQAAQAHRLLETGHAGGKIVLSVRG
jgi:NADPH2:quinone reductase